MKAIGNYILIERLESEHKKVNGLLYTEDLDVDNRFIKGKIISVGNFVQALKQDDVIYYDKHRGESIDCGNKLYQVIRDQDVVIVE